MFNDIRVIAALRTLAVIAVAASAAISVNLIVMWGGMQALMYVAVAFVVGMSIHTLYDIMLFKVKQEQALKDFEQTLHPKVDI